MEFEIKNFISPDISDFKHDIPSDPESFSFLLELTIGIKGEKGGDIFSIHVCTPKWMLENCDKNEVLLGRGKLIVFKYDIDNIIRTINEFLASFIEKSWEEFAVELSKSLFWEFENYKE